MEQSRDRHSTSSLVITGLVAGAIGFGVGFTVGRQYDDHAGHIPCPPCRIVEDTATGTCRLVGKISSKWDEGPITIQGWLAPPSSIPNEFEADSCIDHPIPCERKEVDLEFKKDGSMLEIPVMDIPVCSGPACGNIEGCP